MKNLFLTWEKTSNSVIKKPQLRYSNFKDTQMLSCKLSSNNSMSLHILGYDCYKLPL